MVHKTVQPYCNLYTRLLDKSNNLLHLWYSILVTHNLLAWSQLLADHYILAFLYHILCLQSKHLSKHYRSQSSKQRMVRTNWSFDRRNYYPSKDCLDTDSHWNSSSTLLVTRCNRLVSYKNHHTSLQLYRYNTSLESSIFWVVRSNQLAFYNSRHT